MRCERWKCNNKAKIQCREWNLCNKCYYLFWKTWELEHDSHLFCEVLRRWFGHKRIRKHAIREIKSYIKDIKPVKRKKDWKNATKKKKEKKKNNYADDLDGWLNVIKRTK